MLIIRRSETIIMACIGPRKSEVMLTESVQLVTSAIDCTGWEFMLGNCFPHVIELNVEERSSVAGLNCGM